MNLLHSLSVPTVIGRHAAVVAVRVLPSFFSHDFTRVNGILAVSYGLANKSSLIRENLPTVSFLLASAAASAVASLSPMPMVSDRAETFAWKVLLQASLVLSILSRSSAEREFGSEAQNMFGGISPAVVVAFFMGVCGSVAGGFFSHQVLVSCSGFKSSIYSAAAALVSCLTASYIGGSANFFELGSIIRADYNMDKTLISQVASADIGIMILYFEALKWLRQSKLRKWLTLSSSSRRLLQIKPEAAAASSPAIRKKALTISSQLFFCYQVSRFATGLQDALGIAGMSVALSTLAALGAERLLDFRTVGQILKSDDDASSAAAAASSKFHFKQCAADGSKYLLASFYCVLGYQTRLQSLVSLGPALLLMFFVMLSTHLGVTLGGSLLWNALMKKIGSKDEKTDDQRKNTETANVDEIRSSWRIGVDMDSVVIASNACVGGAATAASMAGSIGREDLILSASATGIVGYLVGTPLGLFLLKVLKAHARP